ncbi:MAG: hypothetical protein A2Z47_10525 [Thermodesulfovibrio sp. RBG_19FT_COMBO_42_12]|nr:MAG: hypothetical protein A2Z47_10525 [Thermodesulfovibrio sp. RBG_19FT_COMBO_42_12]
MYRSNLMIGIDGEDTINSASCEYMHKEQIGRLPQMYFLHGLKTGISMLAILTLANTVRVEDALAKTTAAHSAIIEIAEGTVSYQFLAESLEDKMTDDEFNKAMAALNDIWRLCPEDLPKDLSTKHDHYLGR